MYMGDNDFYIARSESVRSFFALFLLAYVCDCYWITVFLFCCGMEVLSANDMNDEYFDEDI